MRASEPHQVSAPPERYPHARDEGGVVHWAWQIYREPPRMRMGCSYYSLNWDEVGDDVPVSCVWCLAGYHPWLRWGPGMPEDVVT